MRKLVSSIFLVFLTVALMLWTQGCANPGAGPDGGQKDSIPPVITNMVPQPYATNVSNNELIIGFDEYVVQDNLSAKMVISPPLANKPSIKMKGKSIHIKFTEDLIPNRTYSVDLKDGIKDYNEGNKIKSIRMLFSTYESIDTLRISGYLVDAFTLSPVKDAFATLYTLDVDSVFSTLRPDFIAKTDEKGFFLFDNLPEGAYKLYGLTDIDNNLMFSQASEKIAFIDSFLLPSARFIQASDTIFEENDTILAPGYVAYLPDDVYARIFEQESFRQYIIQSKRESRDHLFLTFNESLTDSFQYSLLNMDEASMATELEYSSNRDSLNIWLTDTMLILQDTLFLHLLYTGRDSLNQPIMVNDTLRMVYSSKTDKGKSKNKSAEETHENELFTFKSNITSNNFDLNKMIQLEAPSPVAVFDSTMLTFMKLLNDSVKEPVSFSFKVLENSNRKYIISYEPEEATRYQLVIDSGLVQTRSGIPNKVFDEVFKTQKADYYGTAIIDISGIEGQAILQLLQHSNNETIVAEQKVEPGTKTITFAYLRPASYRLKLIEDLNGNGRWDTGNLDQRQQPEPVYYYQNVLNVKSNWEIKENWMIESGKISVKAYEETKKNRE
ncbi:MAG: Ig-like domain-containing protein [Prolixibacteraceae bacterium]|nr:Ig-like domain-containing protein [Prolixibacteraceae bacterium]